MIEEILDDEQLEHANERRRALLPLWIKIFLWIFLLFAALVPFGLIFDLLDFRFFLSLYGLETGKPLSSIGLVISFLMVIKGIVAFGLWTEKDWAVILAIVDAILGIIVCILVMALLPSNTFRLELLVLLPYLIKMTRIRAEWAAREPG